MRFRLILNALALMVLALPLGAAVSQAPPDRVRGLPVPVAGVDHLAAAAGKPLEAAVQLGGLEALKSFGARALRPGRPAGVRPRGVLLLGVMTVIGTLISDVLLVWIDPRIRIEDT